MMLTYNMLIHSFYTLVENLPVSQKTNSKAQVHAVGICTKA